MAETNETLALDIQGDPLRPTLPFSPGQREGTHGGVPCVAVHLPDQSVAVAIDTVSWQFQGKPRLSVVLKVTLSTEASPMTMADAPEPFFERDQHHRNRPVAHVTAASDVVPYRKQIDVTLVGEAETPAGRSLPEMMVRLALMQRGAVVLDKRLRVVGDRDGRRAPPKPFKRMPITYERAMGGLDSAENPIGCGIDEDDDQPNILDPRDASRPAGLGPIGASWPVRAKRVRDDAKRGLSLPVLEIPGDFDWAYFQAAPADQRIAQLLPETLILLEGFSSEKPQMQLELPDLRTIGAVYGMDAENPEAPKPLGFHPDSLHFDTARNLCVITYRCPIELRDEAQRARLTVVAGVGIGRAPELPESQSAEPKAPPPSRDAPPGKGETLEIISSRPASASLPFEDPLLGGKKAPAKAPYEATFVLPPDEAAAARTAPAAPFAPAQMPVAAPFAPAQMPVAAPFLPVSSAPYVAPPPIEREPRSAPAEPEGPAASAFFHDVSKLRGGADVASRLGEGDVPSAGRAPQRAPSFEDTIPIERYAAICSELEEAGAQRYQILSDHDVDDLDWKKADKHYRKAMDDEIKRGQRGLRDGFDDAYVRAWEARHPEAFSIEHYARLTHGEQRGVLSIEIEALGLGAPLGMRLKRVYRRRVAADPALAERVALAQKTLTAT